MQYRIIINLDSNHILARCDDKTVVSLIQRCQFNINSQILINQKSIDHHIALSSATSIELCKQQVRSWILIFLISSFHFLCRKKAPNSVLLEWGMELRQLDSWFSRGPSHAQHRLGQPETSLSSKVEKMLCTSKMQKPVYFFFIRTRNEGVEERSI